MILEHFPVAPLGCNCVIVGDPEKGAAGEALSVMQTVKLKEIAAKAKGEKKGLQRRPFRRKPASD